MLIAELTAQRAFAEPVVTEVVPAQIFYPAEDYHQGYFDANPNQAYCQYVVAPKVVKARAKFATRWKS